MAALTEAVFAIDARTGLVNLGTGGTALTPTSGSSSGADSNDPTYLAHTGTNYLYLPGVTGNYASVPDSAALSITGDIDLKVLATLPDWTPEAARSALTAKYTIGGQGAFIFAITSAGILELWWSANGGVTDLSAASTVSTGIADGASKWIRATLDVNNGSGNRVVKFYTSDDGSAWTQLGSTVTQTGTTSISDTTATLNIGAYDNGAGWPLTGSIRRVIIQSAYDTADNTTSAVFDADFTTGITSGAQTSFTASTGQTVTINRSTSGQKAVAVTRPCWLFGTSKYLEVADNALLDFAAGEPFTALLAVRRWNTMGASNVYVAKQNQVATGAPAGWLVRGGAATATQVVTHIHDGTNNTATSAPGTLTAGSLTVVGGVRDVTADQVRSFIGSSVASNTDSTTGSSANSEVLRIGRLSGSGTNYIDMELFAVAIWRRALTAAEIADMSTALTNAVLRPTVPDELALTLNTQPGDLLLASQPNDVVLHTTPKGLVLE